jgi:hypothetical protein
MNHMRAWVFLGMVMALVSCGKSGGTETDNPASPLKDFTGSACKNERAEPSQQALTLASALDGLQCVEWAKGDAGALTIGLHNFPATCASGYDGAAVLAEDGALELSEQTEVCSKCGSCVFDFSYDLVGISDEEPLTLRLSRPTCGSTTPSFDDELTLPIDEQPTGLVCRYVERTALEWYASGQGSCGGVNMPCMNCRGQETTCESGTTCTEVESNDSRCLKNCESDDDCVAGATTCVTGVCQANSSY